MDKVLIAYFIGAMLIGFVLIRLYFKIADAKNIIDKPNQRSSHTTITIRGAGIIFPLIALAVCLADGFNYPFLTAGILVIGTVGFIDDMVSLSARVRTVIQMLALSLMFIEAGIFGLAIWIVVALYIFVTGLINAYNFMDGINGMTGLYTMAILVPVLFLDDDKMPDRLLIATVAGCLVFLYYNFRKRAMCFLGDVGSVSIALLVAFVIISLVLETEAWYYFALMSIYGVDSILTIAHRIMRRERIFDAHRLHLYQLLANEEKWPHTRVSAMYASLQLVLNLVLLGAHSTEFRWIFSVLSISTLSIIYIILKSRLVKKHQV